MKTNVQKQLTKNKTINNNKNYNNYYNNYFLSKNEWNRERKENFHTKVNDITTKILAKNERSIERELELEKKIKQEDISFFIQKAINEISFFHQNNKNEEKLRLFTSNSIENYFYNVFGYSTYAARSSIPNAGLFLLFFLIPFRY